MANSMTVDSALSTASSAMEGLNKRSEVISQNIANIDTPGYQAEQISFESTLQHALNTNGTLALTTTQPGHISGLLSETSNMAQISLKEGGSARADGNDVNIDQELQQMTETGITYQAITSAVTKKLSLLKTIASR
jgi:flagellar basal-body rod protein FlgB